MVHINSLTNFHEFCHGPCFSAISNCLPRSKLNGQSLVLKPLIEIGLRLDLYHYRHKGVIFAAKFRALPPEQPRLIDSGPCFIDEPWYRVLLNRKIRYPPRMYYVI